MNKKVKTGKDTKRERRWGSYGIRGDWRAIPTQYRKASDILTSTLAAFLFSSHPKGKGIERLI